jgi:hypothetical protein
MHETEESRHRPVEFGSDPEGPRQLPYGAYPKAVDVADHGLQALPTSLPLIDFARAKPYRSSQYTTVLATELTKDQLLQAAWVIATGFARREPQARHLRPPKHPPVGLMEARHTDPFGTDPFGSWDTETHTYWVVRLTALTDPTSPQGAIELNEEALAQSLAILDGEGRVIGASFNQTMLPLDVEPPIAGGRSVPRHRNIGLGIGLRRIGRPGCDCADGSLRAVPGIPRGLRPGQGQPPFLDCPLQRSSERGHLRARGRGRGALPDARL